MYFKSYMDYLGRRNGIKLKELKTKVLELGGNQQRVTMEGRKVSVT